MAWLVAVGVRANKSLEWLPTADRRRVAAALEAMRVDPLSGDVAKLKGLGTFRRRVGDYRIVFDIDFATHAVRVFDILRRSTTTYR